MKFFLTIAVLCSSLIVFSQARPNLERIQEEEKDPSNSSLIFKMGAGLPQGNFADEDDGIAESGILFEGGFQQQFTDFLYFSLSARFQRNNVDNDIITSALRSELATNGIYGVDVLVSSKPWKMQSFMVGFGSSTPLENKTTYFMTQFAIGYVAVTSPNLIITLSDPGYTEITTQEDATEGALGFRFGLGFKVEASDEIDVLLSGDFFSTNVDFDNVLISSTAGPSENYSFNQDISMFNLSIGIVFKL